VEGTRKIIDAEGRSIGIYNIGGAFHAIRNICPHQGAPLCTGPTVAFVTSDEPGEFTYEREGEILRCPWHQWEFDIKSGCMIVDPKMRTKTYDVTVERFDISVEENQVFVHL
jgi:3-phenylpropionate/trans-cinnamate dioxygenase ferredoxin subunit